MDDAMQKALDFMTWDIYPLAFDGLVLLRPQRSAEEAFVDMRGPGAPDTVGGEGSWKIPLSVQKTVNVSPIDADTERT